MLGRRRRSGNEAHAKLRKARAQLESLEQL